MANIPGTTAGEPLDGTADADVINADAGNDTLNGLGGDDELFGEDGDDTITGGIGTDMLYGGEGDDTLVYDEVTPAEEFDGGNGNDTLELQLGGPLDFGTLTSIEHLLFAPANPLIPLTARISIEHLNSAGIVELTGSAAADQLVLLLQTAGSYTMPNFTLNSWDNPTGLNVGDGGDALVLFGSTSGNYTLTAREGLAATQILVGNTGNDTLTGSSGVDFLGSGGGIDVLDAGGGNDVLSLINRLNATPQFPFTTSFTGAGSTFEGGDGTDMLLIGAYVNFQGTLSGIEGIGLDTGQNPFAINFGETAALEMDLAHYAMLPSNFFVSGVGHVVVQLDAAGVHDFSGVTFTNNAADGIREFIFQGETGGTATPLAIAIGGTSRGDIFVFGHDSYLATGGGGADTFSANINEVVGPNNFDITITDFTPGEDTIDLINTSITSLDRLLGIATQQGDDVVIATRAYGSSITVVLENLLLSALDANDFNFGAFQFDQQNDFNGDHLSDVLWRNADGFVSTWAASGNAIAPTTGLNFVGLDWHAATVGDFNFDGVDDVFWRNDTGAVTYWEGSSSGAFDHDTGFFTYAEAGWNIAGSGDFNGDGYDDILWQNADGGVTWWDSTGTGFAASSAYATVGAGWSVAGTGDFDGDGLGDVLWRNVDGGVTLWTSAFTAFAASSFYASVSADWSVAAIGDFNGDDEDDVLWRNDNGALTFWAGTLTGFDADTGVLDFADVAWDVADAGDYNGDGADDILWQHSDGRVTWWLGTGTGFEASGTTYANAPADWDILNA